MLNFGASKPRVKGGPGPPGPPPPGSAPDLYGVQFMETDKEFFKKKLEWNRNFSLVWNFVRRRHNSVAISLHVYITKWPIIPSPEYVISTWITTKIMHEEGRTFVWRMPGLSALFCGIHIYLIAKKKWGFFFSGYHMPLPFFIAWLMPNSIGFLVNQAKSWIKIEALKKNVAAPWKHMEFL